MIILNLMECQKKCLDINLSKKYGWKPKNNFDDAFKKTYEDFLKQMVK